MIHETVLFTDVPAPVAIEQAVEFLTSRGLTVLHRTDYSVAVTDASTTPTLAPCAGTIPEPSTAERTSEEVPRGTGHIAAVPVQLRSQWTRIWVTVNDVGPVAETMAAFVAAHQVRSSALEGEVRRMEQSIYDDAQWPAHEATLRTSLQRQGVSPEALEARIASFKQRWQALGRKARQAPPE